MAAHLVDVVAHELGHAVVDGGVEDLVELGDVDGAVASGGGGVRRGGGGGGGGAAVEDARGGARGVRGAERGARGRAPRESGQPARRAPTREETGGAPWSRRIRRSTRDELGIDPEGPEPSFGVQTHATEPTTRARARVRVRGKVRARRVERFDRTVERSSECARGSEPTPFEIESPRSHRARTAPRRVRTSPPSAMSRASSAHRRAARLVSLRSGRRAPASRRGAPPLDARAVDASTPASRRDLLRMTSAVLALARGVPAPRPRGRPPVPRDDVSRASRSAPEPIPRSPPPPIPRSPLPPPSSIPRRVALTGIAPRSPSPDDPPSRAPPNPKPRTPSPTPRDLARLAALEPDPGRRGRVGRGHPPRGRRRNTAHVDHRVVARRARGRPRRAPPLARGGTRLRRRRRRARELGRVVVFSRRARAALAYDCRGLARGAAGIGTPPWTRHVARSFSSGPRDWRVRV